MVQFNGMPERFCAGAGAAHLSASATPWDDDEVYITSRNVAAWVQDTSDPTTTNRPGHQQRAEVPVRRLSPEAEEEAGLARFQRAKAVDALHEAARSRPNPGSDDTMEPDESTPLLANSAVEQGVELTAMVVEPDRSDTEASAGPPLNSTDSALDEDWFVVEWRDLPGIPSTTEAQSSAGRAAAKANDELLEVRWWNAHLWLGHPTEKCLTRG